MKQAFALKGVLPMKDPEIFDYFQGHPAFCAFDFLVHCQSVVHRENLKFMDRLFKKSLKKPAELNSLFSAKYDYENYEMTSEELKEYNSAQICEILKYQKHLEEENIPCTVEEAIRQWSDRYSASFRKYWHLKKLTEFF